MKKIGIFCDQLLDNIPVNTAYGQWEIGLGSMFSPIVAFVSFFYSLPTVVFIIVWYKTVTLLLIIVSLLLAGSIELRNGTFVPLVVSLHLFDVIPVWLFKRIIQ